MELLSYLHPLLLFLLLHGFGFLVLLRRTRSSFTTSKFPPSPPRLPIIGNLHQLIGPLPHRTLRAMAARHGPLMLLQLGQVPSLVVSSVDMAREVMKNQDHHFASRPSLTVPNILLRHGRDVAFAPYGEYWRQLKKVSLLHLLSAKMVRSFRHVREEEVAAMIDDISRVCSSAAPFDVTAILNSLAKHVISRVTLGKNSKDESWGDYIDSIMGEASAAMGAFHVGDYFPSLPWLSKVTGLESRIKKMVHGIEVILDEIIANHKNRARGDDNPETKDFVNILISLQDDPEMKQFISDETIKSVVTDMYAAGMDSTHIAIEWAMAELMRNPKAMKKLQDEVRGAKANSEQMITEDDLSNMDYLRAVIKESMRLHPPGPLLVPRELTEETTIEGFRIPKGTRTFINVWAIGRDSKIWKDPEEFRPERFLGSSIDYRGQHFELTPFGAGRRICPGIGFAAAVVELSVANLVNQFDWKLPNGMKEEDMDMGEVFGITMRKKTGLQLVATPRF
ncbi:Cytochrome P450 [Canna indica]|uniref:Cytochrome P450 n=1 Tax=Canna indica TaxID=4628 RepID=A0AAQ3Q3G6_9LILI|nr:Cytochrome P450 [Canna indica]